MGNEARKACDAEIDVVSVSDNGSGKEKTFTWLETWEEHAVTWVAS